MPIRVKPPTLSTLRSYGLTPEDWLAMCRAQRFLCPVCGEPFGDRKLAIDHEHVAGFRARKTRRRNGKVWKVRVMSQAERAVHVRGILHAFCNRFVRKWLTLDRAERILNYLRQHEARHATQRPDAAA